MKNNSKNYNFKKIKGINMKLKNYLSIFVVILLATLFINVIEIKAFPDFPDSSSCPMGYVTLHDTVTVIVDNDTCDYNVRLCVSCPAGTHPVPFEIILSLFEPADSSCILNPIGIQEAIIDVVTDPVWIEENIADDCFAGCGPCDYNAVEVIGVTPLCLRKVKYIDEDNLIKIIYAGCFEDGCTCQRTKIICWEDGHFVEVINDFTRNPIGCISPCEFVQEPPDSSIPDPTPEEPFPQSECFVGNSPCSE